MNKKAYMLIGIAILLILSGGYWLSQNLWVFEKQIQESEYEEFLADTIWESKWNSRDTKVWRLYSNGEFSGTTYEKGHVL